MTQNINRGDSHSGANTIQFVRTMRRQLNRDGESFSFSALGKDLSSVHKYRLACDGKPKSRTFIRSCSTVRQRDERLKDYLFLARRDAGAVVLNGDDADLHLHAVSDIYSHRSRFACKPQTVAKDIVECPAQQLTMACDLERFRFSKQDGFSDLCRFKVGVSTCLLDHERGVERCCLPA